MAVLNKGPWTFNQDILVLRRITETDQVDRVPLIHVDFWIHVHKLPVGFRSSKILQDIGNYVGVFIESDDNNFSVAWRNYLRIRVSMDAAKPLKRRMKLKKHDSEWLWVEFRYEKLTIFCFIIGCLGHTETKVAFVFFT